MPSVEELLSGTEVMADSITYCEIDDATRQISVPEEYRILGVESDEKAKRLYFHCPKIVGNNNVDLTDCILFINYRNAGGELDAYRILDVEEDSSGEYITFSWELYRRVTAYHGDVVFSFCAMKQGEIEVTNEYNTAINTQCTCLEGLEATERVEETNADAIVQIWEAIDQLKVSGGGGGSGTPGKDGREIELQNNGTAIQWRYVGDSGWTDLVHLSSLKGEKGNKGDTGATPNIQIGTVQTLEPGQDATASMTGTAENPLLNLGIPRGKDGESSTGGWSSTQIDLFEAFTNVIAYTSPDANSIVSSLISSLRSGSSDTPEGSFSIIYVLSNVTSSSKDNSIKSGEPYNTTLTANPGYELESVIVKMGGSDITSTAYSDGEITISAVTGNIVITASAVQSSASGQLPQDGLVDYFDFRNKSYTAGGGGLYYINSDYGNGMLYSWSNQSSKQGDNIGLKGVGGNYTTERATGYPVTDNFPSTRTVCLFGKGGPSVPNSIGVDGTLNNAFVYMIKYRAIDKTTKSLSNEQIQYPEGFTKTGYNASFVIVNQNILKVYFDDTLHKTVDGNEIEDFESWDIIPLALTSFGNYGVAYAIYNKELSEVEIVEALEFFKTLEVSE